MRSVRIEIVGGSVQVDRQQINGIESVLLAICLRLNEKHFFGESVRSIRLFRIPIPQVFFFERHWGEFWISANRPYCNKFRNSGLPGHFHELCAHHEVVIEEFSGIGAVGSYAADSGGEVNDEVRLRITVQPNDIAVTDKIVVVAAGNEGIHNSAISQPGDHSRTQKTCATGDNDLLVCPPTHGALCTK